MHPKVNVSKAQFVIFFLFVLEEVFGAISDDAQEQLLALWLEVSQVVFRIEMELIICKLNSATLVLSL